MTNHELHTISLWTRKSDPINLQWLEHRAAIKAARQAEIQRVLQQNKQIRAQEVGNASLMQKHPQSCAV